MYIIFLGVPHDDLLFCFLVLGLLSIIALPILFQSIVSFVLSLRRYFTSSSHIPPLNAKPTVPLIARILHLFLKALVLSCFFFLLRFVCVQSPDSSPFVLLGLDPEAATRADVRRAYRDLARKLHPDKLDQIYDLPNSDDNPENSDPDYTAFLRVREAYERAMGSFGEEGLTRPVRDRHASWGGPVLAYALPTFLTQSENYPLVLAAYGSLGVMLVVMQQQCLRTARQVQPAALPQNARTNSSNIAGLADVLDRDLTRDTTEADVRQQAQLWEDAVRKGKAKQQQSALAADLREDGLVPDDMTDNSPSEDDLPAHPAYLRPLYRPAEAIPRPGAAIYRREGGSTLDGYIKRHEPRSSLQHPPSLSHKISHTRRGVPDYRVRS
jgi:hypothetical protein